MLYAIHQSTLCFICCIVHVCIIFTWTCSNTSFDTFCECIHFEDLYAIIKILSAKPGPPVAYIIGPQDTRWRIYNI